MGGGSWNLEAVSAAFASAAVDPSRWSEAMAVAGAATASRGALLIPVRGNFPGFPFSESIAQLADSYIRDGWIHRDVRYRAMDAISRQGVGTDFDVMSPAEIARHPYYQDFMAGHGFQWFAGVEVASGDDQWVLAIQRLREQGPFSPEEVADLAKVSRKLGSAAALARAFGFARADAAMQAFEISGSAVVLLDRFGDVLRLNAAAERMLRGDLRIERRRVVSHDRNATAALDRALHALIWTRSAAALLPPIRLPRRNRRPILAYPARLSAVSADVLAACQAVLVLVDPHAQAGPPESALRAGFGLTLAEARLAMRLATGEALDVAAGALGITKETARAQLKTVFAKLQVHRQAELVAVLARLLGGAR